MSLEPVTIKQVDSLLSGATPQFSMQLKARLWALIEQLPADHEARRYGEAQMQLLDRLAMGTTRAGRGPAEPPADAAGWAAIPSHPSGGASD